MLGFLCGGETWSRVGPPIPSSPANSMAKEAVKGTAKGAPAQPQAAAPPPAPAPKTTGSAAPGGGPGFAPPGGGPFSRLGDAAKTISVHLNAPVTATVILLAVLLAVAGGLIAGTFCGWRAARLRPADALTQVR